MTDRTPMFIVGQCHDGTDVAVYAASEDDYSDEVLTFAEAEALAAKSARERGCRYFIFTEITADMAPSVGDHHPCDSIGTFECAECGRDFGEDDGFSVTICLDCGTTAERALSALADRLAEGGILAGADMFLSECNGSRDPRIEAACHALRPAVELLYSITERN